MEAFVYLLPLAVAVGVIFMIFFFWAYRNGQFDDLEGPAERMILQSDDDDEAREPHQSKKEDVASDRARESEHSETKGE